VTEFRATTPDTRTTRFDRAAQIKFVAEALKVAAAPKSTDNDGERAECDEEMVYTRSSTAPTTTS
jgi:hypothetical protein